MANQLCSQKALPTPAFSRFDRRDQSTVELDRDTAQDTMAERPGHHPRAGRGARSRLKSVQPQAIAIGELIKVHMYPKKKHIYIYISSEMEHHAILVSLCQPPKRPFKILKRTSSLVTLCFQRKPFYSLFFFKQTRLLPPQQNATIVRCPFPSGSISPGH